MGWGTFAKKILTSPLRALRDNANYKDKATTKKADLLNDVSDFVPQLRAIAPAIKIADNLRKKITDPIMRRVNDIDL